MRRVAMGCAAIVATVSCVSCVVAARGEAAFSGSHQLSSAVQQLQVDLGDSPLEIQACDADVPATCPGELRYDGVWRAVGGTPKDARSNAGAAAIVFEQSDSLASLAAATPTSLLDLVDLEFGTLRLPGDLHLDIRTGLGDIEVYGVRASVTASAQVGDVVIEGGDAGLAVRTGLGDVVVETAGHADLRTRVGDIEVVQSAARSLTAVADRGHIRVVLADDANIDLEIRAAGTIRVHTGAIETITSGSFQRRTGSGATIIVLFSDKGDVTVTRD